MAATGDLTLLLTANGSVRMRLVGQIAGQDSFVDLEKTDSKTIYGVVDADLGPTTRISIGASYQRDDRKGVLWGQLPYWYSDGTRTDWSRSKTTATSWNRWNTVEKTAFLTINQLPPLIGNSYEAGLKSEWMSGRLRGSAAIFRIEQDNFGVVDADGALVPGTTGPAYHAVQGTVSEGYEAEIAGKILPRWDLSLGWSAFRARDANGDPVQAHHPRKVLRMATRYDFTGMLDRLSIGGSLRWESKPPKTANNLVTNGPEPVGQPAYLLVNAMACYALNEHLALQVNVNNLFDKRYFNNNEWFTGFVYGEPRNVRATLRFDF